MAPSVEPTLISLFAGAGGMDLGLERAGWRTVAATDLDGSCVETLRASQAAAIPIAGDEGRTHLEGAEIIQADVRDLSGADLRPRGAARSWRPALLAGGPPCQPWSSAGLQKGLADDRGLLIGQMVGLVAELRPRMVLFENVRGLVTAVGESGKPGEVLEAIKRAYEDLGYATTFATLNAADYGAPQRRVRLFMMATERHALPPFPAQTHSRTPVMDLFDQTKPWVTLREVLAGLPPASAEDVVAATPDREAELVQLEPGTGIRTFGRVESNRPGGHWGYRQDGFLADLDLPSRTIRAAATPDWIRLPDGSHRRLTWRECAALQGFPSDWAFSGHVGARFRQIGNAVQANMAERVGQVLMGSLRDGVTKRAPVSAPLPGYFGKRVRYTEAEHRTNGHLRVRVRASAA